ncbi:MAG: MFS transporter [Flavobacteriia bacterium]|jgi:MFS family permease|nr:MFS transporter [Flavobacteriia bacterium]
MLKRYSKDFWLLSASMFFFMLSFNLILPEMNGFISGLGGSEVKGSIIFLFSVAAGVSRPFAGRLADLIGRKRSVFIGLGIAIAASISYAWVGALSVFFVLRFAHGLSAGFAPTGATALLTDILPPGRKGAAMGLWGTFISLGIGVGQALGSYIFERSNFDTLFMTSAAFGILALLLLSPIKETLPEQQAFQWRQLLIKWEDVVEPSVKPAALIMLLTAISSGLIFVLTPDYSTYLGIANKGYFFGIYVLSTIGIRLVFSSLSDRIGRRETMVIGCSLLVLSMVLLGYADDVWSYSFAAVIFGLATGISSPTLFAWTADLSLAHRRGTGSGTLFIALEIGILIGSGLTFLFYKNTIESARHCLFIAAGFGVIALLILLVQIRSAKSINA